LVSLFYWYIFSLASAQNNEVNNLAKEIREIRDELNRKIDGKSKIFTSTEILELSQKLDKLIVNYLGKK